MYEYWRLERLIVLLLVYVQEEVQEQKLGSFEDPLAQIRAEFDDVSQVLSNIRIDAVRFDLGLVSSENFLMSTSLFVMLFLSDALLLWQAGTERNRLFHLY